MTAHEERLRLMAADEHGAKWDLSPNDRAACAAGADALAENERLRELLRELGWETRENFTRCSWCGAQRKNGHDRGCKLDAALGGERG